MEPYIGEIKMFAGNFNPKGWALCNDIFTMGTAIGDEHKFQAACFNQQYTDISFFDMNNICVPAWHAAFYGLNTGQRFTNA